MDNFHGDNVHGLITPNRTVASSTDPVDPLLFSKIEKFSKVELQPGAIKTSYLKTHSSGLFNELFQKISISGSVPSYGDRLNYGKWSVIQLQKLIDSADNIPISVALETSVELAMKATFGFTRTMLQNYSKVYVTL